MSDKYPTRCHSKAIRKDESRKLNEKVANLQIQLDSLKKVVHRGLRARFLEVNKCVEEQKAMKNELKQQNGKIARLEDIVQKAIKEGIKTNQQSQFGRTDGVIDNGNVNMDENGKLMEAIYKKGWIMDPQDADGNCLFRCIAKEIDGHSDLHFKVRGECCQHFRDNKAHFAGFFAPTDKGDVIYDNFEAAVSARGQNGAWGDHIDITAMSEMYGVRVEVYEYDQKHGLHRQHSDDIFLKWYAEQLPIIRLLRSNHSHYDLICDPNAKHARPLGRIQGRIERMLRRNNTVWSKYEGGFRGRCSAGPQRKKSRREGNVLHIRFTREPWAQNKGKSSQDKSKKAKFAVIRLEDDDPESDCTVPEQFLFGAKQRSIMRESDMNDSQEDIDLIQREPLGDQADDLHQIPVEESSVESSYCARWLRDRSDHELKLDQPQKKKRKINVDE